MKQNDWHIGHTSNFLLQAKHQNKSKTVYLKAEWIDHNHRLNHNVQNRYGLSIFAGDKRGYFTQALSILFWYSDLG